MGIDGVIYPQTCLKHPLKPNTPTAWRIKADDVEIGFDDVIQGHIKQNLSQQIGDFILQRTDGLYAYQLAAVADDAAQNITHIVRGADFLDSTPRQIYLQKLLGYTTPQYAHVPIASNAAGENLSKQTLAKPIEVNTANPLLYDALCFLGQHPPETIKNATFKEGWRWAITHWNIANVSRQRIIPTQSY